ncbi:MAG TPA: methyltransferase domain-containing protein [Phycisphaerae bacterium]|nr:methyltransferase domain-containing protein [Phycisphaerae bacterium]
MTTSDSTERTPPASKVDFYDSTYGRFDDSLYREIRQETWQDDFGQNGWITAREQDEFIEWLSLRPGQHVLDIACGSGGPSLRIVAQTRATVVGVDIHPDGVRTGRQEAARRGLSDLASFEVIDAQGHLPFADGSFDVVICIDAINHLADRTKVLTEWARVLQPGGRLLFTDPVVVTGPLTSEEIAARSSIGFFLFVAPDTNERMLIDTGFRLTKKADLSGAIAQVATNWHAARQKRADKLRIIEGVETFEGQQRFLSVAARLPLERRLSRFAYLACTL